MFSSVLLALGLLCFESKLFSTVFLQLCMYYCHEPYIVHAPNLAGASPTSDVLGPQLVAAPQQQALVPQCFTFRSRSPPNAEAEQEATYCYEPPSQNDDLVSAFNGLSLRNDHPCSSAMSVEAASSDTGNDFPLFCLLWVSSLLKSLYLQCILLLF
jgi:hypothetical protein